MAVVPSFSLEYFAYSVSIPRIYTPLDCQHLRLECGRCRYGGHRMTQPHSAGHEIHPQHPPVVPIPQNPLIPERRLQRLVNLFPGGQFARYVCVGVFNTLFGYLNFVVILTLLNAALPAHLLYLTVILASTLAVPLNITVAYLGYKFFVFRTKGNYLGEWLKSFAVYGTGVIPGLVALSALTRFLQSMIHRHATSLHVFLSAVEHHLSGHPLLLLQHITTGNAIAGYIAGAVVIGVSTIYSFVGHKKVTFRTNEAAQADPLS
jgi:putative flippase GtrA